MIPTMLAVCMMPLPPTALLVLVDDAVDEVPVADPVEDAYLPVLVLVCEPFDCVLVR